MAQIPLCIFQRKVETLLRKVKAVIAAKRGPMKNLLLHMVIKFHVQQFFKCLLKG